ncbi:MAG: translation initiation factor [Synergistota bacterium]|nr:translation initiation factor [Synergistota bacterium]
MSTVKKKRKLTSGEGFTLGADESLGLSIGAIFGGDGNKDGPLPPVSEEKTGKVKSISSEKENENGISRLSRVSLQRQTAGRKGKTVTAVIVPKDSNIDRDQLAKDMRKGLGCGSFVENGNVILQGDICDRARDWLLKKGVKEVISGN